MNLKPSVPVKAPRPCPQSPQQADLSLGPVPNALGSSVYVRGIPQTKRSKQGAGFIPYGLEVLRQKHERMKRIKERRERPEKKGADKGNGNSPGKGDGSSPGKAKGIRKSRRRK